MRLQKIKRLFYTSIFLLILFSNVKAQETIYNNFGSGHGGWDYEYQMGWTISGTDVSQQYGVEQAIGFESTKSGVVSDIWVAISYCNPSSLPDTVVLFLVENPNGLPPDSANIMEQWTLAGFSGWTTYNEPFHLEANGTSYLKEGKSYWLWGIGKETTWTMWCFNEDASLTCPHTIRREGEDWLGISNETASAFRIDVVTNVGIQTPGKNNSDINILSQNYPNPFQSSTNITYSIEATEHVKLIVYDMYGKEVNVLVDEFKSAGKHTITFSPEKLQNGIYFYRMLTGSKIVDMKKMSYQN